MFVKMSLHERLFMLVDFEGMNLRVLLLPPPSCFLNVFLPTLAAADFEIFSPNYFCHFRYSILQQVSSNSSCRWDDKFFNKGNCGSPNNLSKCSKSSLRVVLSLLYNTVVQVLLRQPFRTVFIVSNECLKLF